MFGIFKKQPISDQKQEIDKIFNRLREADKLTLVALHNAISLFFNIFIANFKSLENFRKLEDKVKWDYLMKLQKMEQQMAEEKKPFENVAAMILGLYLSTFLEDSPSSDHKYKITRLKVENFIKYGSIS